MDYLYYYLILATSGALLSVYNLFLPVRNKLLENESTHSFVTDPIKSMVIWTILATVAIPFITKAILFDQERDKFIEQVYKGAKKS